MVFPKTPKFWWFGSVVLGIKPKHSTTKLLAYYIAQAGPELLIYLPQPP
jgi:hypothetical protein